MTSERAPTIAESLSVYVTRVVTRHARAADFLAIGIILAVGLATHAPGLSHAGIAGWDEGLHQAAVRGTSETPLRPHIYEAHLFPFDRGNLLYAQEWLHTPPLPLWLSAFVLHFTGITPLAARLVALLAHLGTACFIFLFLKERTSRLSALLAALSFLYIRFGWLLVSGQFFGDLIDATLTFFVTASMLALVHLANAKTMRAAIGAGVLVGLSYMSKSVLGLAALPVAAALVVASRFGFSAIRWTHFCVFLGACMALILPWGVFTFVAYPEAFEHNVKLIAGHITLLQGVTAANVGGWNRPFDAVFVELPSAVLFPFPAALFSLASLWTLARGLWARDTGRLVVGLWVTVTLVAHSVTSAKPPGHLWNCVPGLVIALVLTIHDARHRAPLAAALLATWASPNIFATTNSPFWKRLEFLREFVPNTFVQVRSQPGYFEALCLALVFALAVGVIARLVARKQIEGVLFGACITCIGFTAVIDSPQRLRDEKASHAVAMATSYTRELGLSLAQLLPAKSVLFQNIEFDPPSTFEMHNLMFWSGKITYRQPLDSAAAMAKGYQPYLISSSSEAFEEVPGVPACAWLRAYNPLKALQQPSPLPHGVEPLDLNLGDVQLKGFAHCSRETDQDVWTFYLTANGAVGPLLVQFETRRGNVPVTIPAEASLKSATSLLSAGWYIAPTLGPKASEVISIRAGPARLLVWQAPSIGN